MPSYILHSYKNESLGKNEFGPVEFFVYTTDQKISPVQVTLNQQFHIQNSSTNINIKIYAYIEYNGFYLKNLCGDVTVQQSVLSNRHSWIVKPRADSSIILTRDINLPVLDVPPKKREWWEEECAKYVADSQVLYDEEIPSSDPSLKRVKLMYYPVHSNTEYRPGFTYLYHHPYDIAAYEPWLTHLARISRARRQNKKDTLLFQLERLVTCYAQSAVYKPDFVEEFGTQRVGEVFDYLELTHAGDCDDLAKSIMRTAEILQQGRSKFLDTDGLATLSKLANHFVFFMALVSLKGTKQAHMTVLAIPRDAFPSSIKGGQTIDIKVTSSLILVLEGTGLYSNFVTTKTKNLPDSRSYSPIPFEQYGTLISLFTTGFGQVYTEFIAVADGKHGISFENAVKSRAFQLYVRPMQKYNTKAFIASVADAWPNFVPTWTFRKEKTRPTPLISRLAEVSMDSLAGKEPEVCFYNLTKWHPEQVTKTLQADRSVIYAEYVEQHIYYDLSVVMVSIYK